MPEVVRCPVCGERVPQPPTGTRGRRPVYCEQTEGACQAWAKAARAQAEALARIVDRTTSYNLARMQRRVSTTIREEARDLAGELASEMSFRRGDNRPRESAKAR